MIQKPTIPSPILFQFLICPIHIFLKMIPHLLIFYIFMYLTLEYNVSGAPWHHTIPPIPSVSYFFNRKSIQLFISGLYKASSYPKSSPPIIHICLWMSDTTSVEKPSIFRHSHVPLLLGVHSFLCRQANFPFLFSCRLLQYICYPSYNVKP